MIAEADVKAGGQAELNRGFMLINSKYTLRNKKDVFDFISNNQQLLPLLKEAHDRIRDYFPLETLFLEVMIDPDEVGEKELVIYIHTDQKPYEAIENLDRLDECWWLDASTISELKLLIQVEYE